MRVRTISREVVQPPNLAEALTPQRLHAELLTMSASGDWMLRLPHSRTSRPVWGAGISKEAQSVGNPVRATDGQDEDIVHAPWRHGEVREQGSRSGSCGWITSFLGSTSVPRSHRP